MQSKKPVSGWPWVVSWVVKSVFAWFAVVRPPSEGIQSLSLG